MLLYVLVFLSSSTDVITEDFVCCFCLGDSQQLWQTHSYTVWHVLSHCGSHTVGVFADVTLTTNNKLHSTLQHLILRDETYEFLMSTPWYKEKSFLLQYVIAQNTHLSIKVEGETGDTVCVHVLQYGHRLHSIRVPHTNTRLLSNLSCGHQHSLWMQG